MPPLPVLSARQVVGAPESLGWHVARQRGSHIIVTKPRHLASLSVPDHREVARGTLRSLIRSAGLTVEELVDAAGGIRAQRTVPYSARPVDVSVLYAYP